MSAFMEKILAFPLPLKYTLPLFSKYSGISDAVEHMKDFKWAMSLASGDDPYLCRAFPNNLEKDALARFHQLKSNSISSFKSLTTEFVKN